MFASHLCVPMTKKWLQYDKDFAERRCADPQMHCLAGIKETAVLGICLLSAASSVAVYSVLYEAENIALEEATSSCTQ